VIAAGVTHYDDNSLSGGVKFAATDAALVAARFEEQEGSGLYRKVKAVPLIDSQVTKKGLADAIDAASAVVKPCDTFILYLAGHGRTAEGEYYFIPWEAEYRNEKDLLANSLSREMIQNLLKKIQTNKSAVILDTCSAGAFIQGRTTISEKAAIEKLALMSGRAVLAASNTEQMAMEGYQGHGVFTYTLLEGLRAARADGNGDILISALAEFVQTHVPRRTEEKWKYRQSPCLQGGASYR
jgi:uncharacterized caspase-like protein